MNGKLNKERQTLALHWVHTGCTNTLTELRELVNQETKREHLLKHERRLSDPQDMGEFPVVLGRRTLTKDRP
jgi:hypothetical protein